MLECVSSPMIVAVDDVDGDDDEEDDDDDVERVVGGCARRRPGKQQHPPDKDDFFNQWDATGSTMCTVYKNAGELRYSSLQLQVRIVSHSGESNGYAKSFFNFVSYKKKKKILKKIFEILRVWNSKLSGIFINIIRQSMLGSLVGIAILLSGSTAAVIGNPNVEDAYYLAETNDERSMDLIEKSRYELEGGSDGLVIRNEYEDEQSIDKNNRESDESDGGKIEEKRSILKMNLDRRSSSHVQAPAPLSTLLYWPNREEELVTMEQRSNPMMEERRNPSFSPWGGKRTAQHYSTMTKIRRPVRVPFNSWGGKRSSQTIADLKRGKFLKWAGKKAPPFNSWGGKRSANVDFHLVPLNHHQAQRERQRINNPEARKNFQSESGAEESYSEKSLSNETWEKRGSLKPSASGDITTSGSTMGDSFQRVPFEPWGGKKRAELTFNDDSQPSAGVSLIFRKIGQFIPWSN